MRLANGRHAWLRRGIAGVGFAAPLALAPALPVTVNPEARVAESDRPADVADANVAPAAAAEARYSRL
jgi:hypothetical protein